MVCVIELPTAFEQFWQSHVSWQIAGIGWLQMFLFMLPAKIGERFDMAMGKGGKCERKRDVREFKTS